ncbi:hypothetical protein HanIR_Chr13g0622691 [Helianthus annuus]|nr:hypothetical protein HanIR_Chr13g0622691 [Helianthus annuus]
MQLPLTNSFKLSHFGCLWDLNSRLFSSQPRCFKDFVFANGPPSNYYILV